MRRRASLAALPLLAFVACGDGGTTSAPATPLATPVVTIPMTARVVFVNEDGAAHSVAWADGTPSSPTLANGDSTERSFAGAPAGTLAYACGIHGSSMSGRVVIDSGLPVP